LFAPAPHPLLAHLAALDPNQMTPLDALARLATLVADAQRAVGSPPPADRA
jgi:hypothetical protein